MREGMGKYRGISIDSGKWLYGCLLHDAMKEKASYYILSDDVMNFDEYEAVKDGSVGQFTGLRDKNGVEIYEGDLLDEEDKGGYCSSELMIVEWFPDRGCLGLKFEGDYLDDFRGTDSTFICGNIHTEATK